MGKDPVTAGFPATGASAVKSEPKFASSTAWPFSSNATKTTNSPPRSVAGNSPWTIHFGAP